MSLINFNQEQAENAGVGTGAQTSGAYVGMLETKHIIANTGTKGLEFTLHGQQDVNYMTCYYEKKDGTPIRGGMGFIQAIMGILRVNAINIQKQTVDGTTIDFVPELCNKPIGLVVQKVLYTKNDGTDGYKFEIVMPFHDQQRKTYQELTSNSPAATVDKILATLVDKDERKPHQPQGGYDGGYGGQQTQAGYGNQGNMPQSKLQQANQVNNNEDAFHDQHGTW